MRDAPSPADDAHLDAVLIGGREPRQVLLVEYSHDWPKVFEEHRLRIMGSVGGVARRVEHIGSTAVPELASKPVVDIMVTVDDPDDEAKYLQKLEGAGYVLRVRESGHRMFRTPQKDVHVHVWRAGSSEEAQHLLFRDHLRSHADERRAYEALKRSLTGHWNDVNYYAEAKGPFIRRVLNDAARPRESAERPRLTECPAMPLARSDELTEWPDHSNFGSVDDRGRATEVPNETMCRRTVPKILCSKQNRPWISTP